MLKYDGKTVRTSVRRLVEFILRSGDIHTGSAILSDPEVMQEGGRLHRKIQSRQKATYRSEVSLKKVWKKEAYDLILEGRADGIDRKSLEELTWAESQKDFYKYFSQEDKEEARNNPSQDYNKEDHDNPSQEGKEEAHNNLSQDDNKEEVYGKNIPVSVAEEIPENIVVIDEIKCVLSSLDEKEEADPLHLAQAKCYACIYALEEGLPWIAVQITYCHMETEEIRRLAYFYRTEDLQEWFDSLIDSYDLWASYYVKAIQERNQSIGELTFPFEYRTGQKTLLAMVYNAIATKKPVLLQAPTGVGKTISAIFPAIKSLGEGKAEHIFYLTAKTITRTVAEETLEILRSEGLQFRSVTITAKEKICVCEEMNCNPSYCERAKGHYDRINEAVYQLLQSSELLTREKILEYSEKYKVCPYELAFETAVWADMVICDYNYVFDPYVNRRAMFGDQVSETLYLIDEAHNLPDRAREMYSQVISMQSFVQAKAFFRKKSKKLTSKIQSCITAIDKIQKKEEYIENDYKDIDVDGLYFPLFHLITPFSDYMKDHEEFEGRDDLIEFFFGCYHALQILDDMEEGYYPYAYKKEKDFHIRLFCVDPSAKLEEYLAKSRSSIFFSATILPVPYYKQLLGGQFGMDAFSIPSSFPKENRLIAIASDVTSRYTRRGEAEYRRMVRYIEAMVQTRTGNYMIFFPSYDMLNQVYALSEESTLSMFADFLVQTPDMSEQMREEFLNTFQDRQRQVSGRSLIAFCVLGSIFSEGIDLTGQRLIGVAIVGTGLPMVCREREMIRTYFDNHQKKGYDYAYRYPGINKVLQAAGRVIRTAEDIGIILLLEERFLYHENQILLPGEWDRYYEVNQNNVSLVLQDFWKDR